MIKLGDLLPELTAEQKKNLWKVVAVNFFIFFSYPMIRSVSSTFFLEVNGASELPKAWFLSVLVLVFTIALSNRLQPILGVQKLFFYLAVISGLVFFSYQYVPHSYKWPAYALLVWKEVYIVLLVHLMLAYTNSLVSLGQMKTLYGPFGAVGSVGGILGGLITSIVTKGNGSEFVLAMSSFLLLIPAVIFISTKNLRKYFSKDKEKEKPLQAIANIRPYVFLIALMISMSQFCINIADLQFNLLFEKVVTSVDRKTELFGYLYSAINFFTLVVQFCFLPFLLNYVKTERLLIAVPVIYFALSFFGLGLGGGLLWVVAISFVSFKGVDYSLFGTTKELLYHPMTYIQKYGAKYICDMFTYRTSKSIISLVLIFVQNTYFLNALMISFLFVWFVAIKKLFALEKTLFQEKLA